MKKKVLLLGAGYANLSLLKALPSGIFDEAEFTLVSQTNQHYTSILLHEVVSGVREESAIFFLNKILPQKVCFIRDSVVEIQKNRVIGQNASYSYDILIVGLGFQSDTFGIKGIREYATPIVNYEGALGLHEKIKTQIMAYKEGESRALHFAICGGGFSGIELIASLAEELPRMCEKMGADTEGIKLTCIEANATVLPMFSPSLVEKGTAYLKGLGIELATGCKIMECQQDGVIVEKNGDRSKIDAGMIVWTAGVKGNAVIENSPFFTSQRSKVEVNSYMQPINQANQEDMKNIFILGDCAALRDATTGRFYPPTAQLATKEGEYLAAILEQKIRNQPITTEFHYNTQGTICSLGENCAIGTLGESSKEITGKSALYLKHLIEAKWRYKLNGFAGVFNGK